MQFQLIVVFQPATDPPPAAALLPKENRVKLQCRSARGFAGKDTIESIFCRGQTFVVAPKESTGGVGERPRVHGLEDVVVPRRAMIKATREVVPEQRNRAGIVVINKKHTHHSPLG